MSRSFDNMLLKAVIDGNVGRAEELLDEHADANAADSNGRSALFHAAWRGDEDMARLLLAHGAEANVVDDDGQGPLAAALEQRRYPVAELLVKEGCADVNLKAGDKGMTVLHWAYNMDLRDKTADRCLWLVERGARAGEPNKFGKDIFARAAEDEHKWPEGMKIAESITGYFNEKARRAAEAEAARIAAITNPVYAGASQDLAVKPIRLKTPAA